MNNKTSKYDKFVAEIEDSANKINLKKAIATDRKGKAGARDKFVFGKFAWAEALSYMALITSAFIVLGLVDDVIENINSAFMDIGLFLGFAEPFQFSVNIASYVAIIFVVFVFCFGLIAVRYIGTSKRSYELSTKMNAGSFTLWTKLDDIQDRLNKLEASKND